jgi:hypothetical protein
MAFFKNNKSIKGSYMYNREPDLIPDKKSIGSIGLTFDRGKLTDRKEAVKQGRKSSSRNHIISWSDSRNVEIKFCFDSKINFSGLKMIYSGRCPSIELYGKKDKDVFKLIGKAKARDVGIDVDEIQIKSNNHKSISWLKLHMNEDTFPANLIISEIEIWGSEIALSKGFISKLSFVKGR